MNIDVISTSQFLCNTLRIRHCRGCQLKACCLYIKTNMSGFGRNTCFDFREPIQQTSGRHFHAVTGSRLISPVAFLERACMCTHSLNLNIAKTDSLIIGSRQRIAVEINDCKVEKVDSVKSLGLGVYIDRHLK